MWYFCNSKPNKSIKEKNIKRKKERGEDQREYM
jgi:hypothetical protein